MRLISVFLLFSLVFILFGDSEAQPSGTQAAALRHAQAIASFVTSGDRSGYAKFVEANFGTELLKMPMERHLNFMSSLHDQTRGFEVGDVQEWNANEVVVLVKAKLTGAWDGLLVRVEPDTYKIAGIGLRPAKKAPVETKRLSAKEIGADLGAFAKKLADADVFSGSILLAKDGEVVYKGAFGMANKDFNAPNRTDTIFNLGSMNKMFTAVAIAQLVEKGKLSFDDPLAKFIPDFPNAEAAKKIQIRHLLSHTAGLGGYFSERFWSTSRDRIRTVDDMMKLAREDEKDIAFEPGSRWRYSNTGMMVLGKVIEVVSGQSYFDYVRENIYKPAGMANTDCYELDKVNTNLAVGYDKQFSDKGVEWGNNIFAHVMRGGPQGGGYSTVEDLLKFERALRGGKLVSPAMLKILTTPKPELNSPNYGFGFGVDTARDVAGHSGGFPGISSNLDMFMGSGWTAIVMSNYSRGSGALSQKMSEMVGPVNKTVAKNNTTR
jgi:CubicO group peptidase (beta-lactamase class C family)